jgi:phage-related protein
MHSLIEFETSGGASPINEFRVSVRRSGDLQGLRRLDDAIERLKTVGLGLLNTAMMDNIEDNIYEIRARHYRVFCYYDRGRSTFVLLNGFRKQTGRTPLREIERARHWAAEYRRTRGG